jgi:hypothetical protein
MIPNSQDVAAAKMELLLLSAFDSSRAFIK